MNRRGDEAFLPTRGHATRRAAGLLCALLCSTVTGPDALARSDPIAACDARVRSRSDDYSSFHCYLEAARRERRWQDAALRLEGLLALDPGNTFARVVLARVESDREHDRAEELFRRSADEFAARRMPVGEVLARLDLAFFLRRRGRLGEAAGEVERARAAAEAAEAPALVANAISEEGWLAYAGADYGRALDTFQDAERRTSPDASWWLRSSILSGEAATFWAMGRNRESFRIYQDLAEGHREHGDPIAESNERYNIALLASRLEADGVLSADEVRALEEEALQTAIASGNRPAECSARLSIAQDRRRSLGERLDEAERSLALARSLKDEGRLCGALREVARLRYLADPRRLDDALRLADEAMARARARGDPQQIARGSIRLAELRWVAGDRDRALADSLAALDAIERIRDLQQDDVVRARLGAEWTFYYYAISGRLLRGDLGPSSDDDLDLAFRIAERLRGRVLLDRLDAARASARPESGSDLARRRGEVLDRVARLQARLQVTGLPREDRERDIDELERLGTEEASLRDQLAATDPAFARLRRPALPGLEEVRAALEPGEAMLAFQLSTGIADVERGTEDFGGSWVFVVTPEAASVRPLPDEDVIEQEVSLFLGMVDRRDGSEEDGAVRLHRDLLAVAALPDSIERLVIVPDKVLFRLPFEVLRPAAGAEPLGVSHEVSVVPSAAVWLRGRRTAAAGGELPVLVFADPERTGCCDGIADERQGPEEGRGLQRLPQARREARAIVAALGRRGEARIGAAATEAELGVTSWSRYRVVHFATHALVDEEVPERTAILLAPGGEEADGLLHLDEIASLDLDGQLVVLAACRSSAGLLLRGEGAVSLARAFFQAGARAVIGNLWRLRDEESAEMIAGIYHHLGRGESAASALRAVRAERIRAGVPAAAWGGFVLLGDGAMIPFPEGRDLRGRALQITLVAAALAGAGLAVLLLRRRGRSRALDPSPPSWR